MKRIFAILMFLALFVSSQCAFATKIPEKELGILKQAFPTLNVRFDGLIELPDGTNYIPVFPAYQMTSLAEIKVAKTIPNKSLKEKPDFVMFNTNFALFKIIKNKNNSTIIYNDEIPQEVKMGLLPQDLLVPRGFQIPDSLRIIIGDLIIPVQSVPNYKEKTITQVKTTFKTPQTKIVEKTAQQKGNKYFYTTNFKKNVLTILNGDNGKAFKEIEFNSIPSDLKLTNNGKYLLVSTIRNGNTFIIDTDKTSVVTDIKAGEKPFYIAVADLKKQAYIANRGESTISVVDLDTMKLLDPINVQGNPCYIEVEPDNSKLYYLDSISGTVYSVQPKEDYFEPYSIKPLFKTNNIAKFQLVGSKIYTLDRGTNTLDVFYLKGKPQEKGIVNVSDITPVSAENYIENSEKTVVNTYDSNNNKVTEDKPFTKERKSFKERTRIAFRKLLYYTDEQEGLVKQEPNIANQVQVLDVKYASPKDKISNAIDNDLEEIADKPKKKTAKEKFHDFLKYKEEKKEVEPIEKIKLAVNKQMDFVTPENRANDFIVANNKIYFLCSDDYTILVYDLMAKDFVKSIKLNSVGYYNSLKISNDRKTVMVTNISSKELTLFDVETDEVVKILPLNVDVHNIVIIGR